MFCDRLNLCLDAKKANESTRQRQTTINQTSQSTPVGVGISEYELNQIPFVKYINSSFSDKKTPALKLGVSYTEQREAEVDFFKKIIDNTVSYGLLIEFFLRSKIPFLVILLTYRRLFLN